MALDVVALPEKAQHLQLPPVADLFQTLRSRAVVIVAVSEDDLPPVRAE